MAERLTLVRVASWSAQPLPFEQKLSVRVMQFAPDEWLIVSRDGFVPAAPAGFSVVDVTHGYAVIEAEGTFVRERLASGCGLDLHPQAFPPGHYARTRFAQVSAIIECIDVSRFRLYVARSHGRYVRQWLDDVTVTSSAP